MQTATKASELTHVKRHDRERRQRRVHREPQRGRGLKRCLVLLHLLMKSKRPVTVEQLTERLNIVSVEEWSARTIKRDLAAMKQLNLVQVHRGQGFTIVRDQSLDCLG